MGAYPDKAVGVLRSVALRMEQWLRQEKFGGVLLPQIASTPDGRVSEEVRPHSWDCAGCRCVLTLNVLPAQIHKHCRVVIIRSACAACHVHVRICGSLYLSNLCAPDCSRVPVLCSWLHPCPVPCAADCRSAPVLH
jgi:hypothetical protein